MRAGFEAPQDRDLAPIGDANGSDVALPDARLLDGSGHDTQCELAPFSQPSNLASVNTNRIEYSPSISGDGLTLIFGSPDRTGGVGSGDLWIAVRAAAGDAFGAPALLGSAINTDDWEGDAELSFDGLTIFFDRKPGGGDLDIYAATRGSSQAAFDGVAPVAGVNSPNTDQGSCISADGRVLYFGTDRAGGQGETDIWVVQRATDSGVFSAAQPVAGLNSAAYDGFPSISGDGLTIYFETLRDGRPQVWHAQQAGDAATFTGAAPLESVNSNYSDGDPEISADGRTLYFASDRPGGQGDFDIWIATRDCVE